MPFAQGDNMVGALATDRSDQPPGDAVLPRRTRGAVDVRRPDLGVMSSGGAPSVFPVLQAWFMAASALPEPRTTTAVTRALPFAERIAHPIRSPSYNYNVNHSAVRGRTWLIRKSVQTANAECTPPRAFYWWALQGLNLRPLPCEVSGPWKSSDELSEPLSPKVEV